nr:hypothetical protein [Alphaproteobacteria bacterium]
MKKSLILTCFLLSSTSLLQAKGGVESLFEGPEAGLKVRVARAIKTQKVRVVENFIKLNPDLLALPLLKTHYENQIAALQQVEKLLSSPSSYSNPLDPLADSKLKYNIARENIKETKTELNLRSKQILKTAFASINAEGAAPSNVKYNSAHHDHRAQGDAKNTLKLYEGEFYAHAYHQFIEWRNYATFLNNAGHKETAFLIYQKILPLLDTDLASLRKETLPARDYANRFMSTDEVLEMTYYEAGNLGLNLEHFESALNFHLCSQRIAKELHPPVKRQLLPYQIAVGWHTLGNKENNLKCAELATEAYKEYFNSSPKEISLDLWIQAASAALSAQKIEEASEWTKKVIDTLKVTLRVEELQLQHQLRINLQKLGAAAYKASDFASALTFYEGIVQNPTILNQPSVNSSMQYYNAGTLAYLAKQDGKARTYLSQVDLQDPLIGERERVNMDLWLKEIEERQSDPKRSQVVPSSSGFLYQHEWLNTATAIKGEADLAHIRSIALSIEPLFTEDMDEEDRSPIMRLALKIGTKDIASRAKAIATYLRPLFPKKMYGFDSTRILKAALRYNPEKIGTITQKISKHLTEEMEDYEAADIIVAALKDDTYYFNKLTENGRALYSEISQREDIENIKLDAYFNVQDPLEEEEAIKAISTIMKILAQKIIKPIEDLLSEVTELDHFFENLDDQQISPEEKVFFLSIKDKIVETADKEDIYEELLTTLLSTMQQNPKFQGSTLLSKFESTQKSLILTKFLDKLRESDELGELEESERLKKLKTTFADLLQEVPENARELAEIIGKASLKGIRLEILKDKITSTAESVKKLDTPLRSSVNQPQAGPSSSVPSAAFKIPEVSGPSSSLPSPEFEVAPRTFRTTGVNLNARNKHSAISIKLYNQALQDAVYKLIVNHRTTGEGPLVRVYNPKNGEYIGLGSLPVSLKFDDAVFNLSPWVQAVRDVSSLELEIATY